MKKILGLTIAAILVMGLVAGGTWAYFNDQEQSTGNILSAGTLDLTTNDADGVSGSFTLTNMKPGDNVPTGGVATIALKNVGSIAADHLDIDIALANSDGTPTAEFLADLTADEFAAGVTITDLHWGTTDLLDSLTDSNSNGRKDLNDLEVAASTLLKGLTAPTTGTNFTIRVQLDSAVDNTFQADGVDVTVTFAIFQSATEHLPYP